MRKRPCPLGHRPVTTRWRTLAAQNGTTPVTILPGLRAGLPAGDALRAAHGESAYNDQIDYRRRAVFLHGGLCYRDRSCGREFCYVARGRDGSAQLVTGRGPPSRAIVSIIGRVLSPWSLLPASGPFHKRGFGGRASRQFRSLIAACGIVEAHALAAAAYPST